MAVITDLNGSPILDMSGDAIDDSPILFDAPPVTPTWMFPGADLNPKAEVRQSNNNWLDISSRVFYDTVTLQRGGPDESTTVSPASFSGTLDNSDGFLSNLNVYSPNYELLPLNSHLRISVPNGSTYLRLEDDQSSYITSSSTITGWVGGAEIWIDADADNWYSPQFLAGVWTSNGNQRRWALMLPGDGTVQLILSTDGTINSGKVFYVGSSATLPITHGRLSIRIVFNQTAGTVTFYTGQYCANWVQLGDVMPATTTGLFNPNVPITIGHGPFQTDYNETGFNGKIYAFTILGGVQGGSYTNPLCALDFTALPLGMTSYTDGAGRIWVWQGTAAMSDRDYRFHGECSAWPQEWTPGGDNNVRVTISAGGLLRRMGGTNTPANSPMYRAYTRTTTAGTGIIGYWSAEDKGGSTQVASAIPGVNPGFTVGPVQMASDSSFACSAPLPVLNGGSITFNIPSYSIGSTTGYSGSVLRWLMVYPSGDTANAAIARILLGPNNAGASYIDLVYDANASGIAGTLYNASGASMGSVNSGIGAGNMANMRMSLELVSDGSTWHAQLVWMAVGAASGYFVTVATGLSGNPPTITRVIFNPGLPGGPGLLTKVGIGHVSIQNYWSSLFDMGGAMSSYDGEVAGVRFQRFCNEEGIPFRSIGDITDTTPMGPQTIQTITQLLQECVDADQGIWYEPRQVLGFGYRTRVSTGNQLATVEFDYNQDQLSGSLKPTVDDQTIKNDVTVTSQNGGSSARRVLDDGSVTSIGKIGRYDASFPVNVDNTWLDYLAGWKLWALSCRDPRYPSIECDLANSSLGAALYYAILQSEVGDRLIIRNPPVWLPPTIVDQIIKGVREVISDKSYVFTWNGIPAKPWNTAYMDDIVYGRVDTDGSTLAASLAASSGSQSLLVSGYPWTQNPADLPFDIGVVGEQMTVTGITSSNTARVGAYLNESQFEQSTYTGTSSLWNVWTGKSPKVIRYYAGTNYTYSTDLQEMVTAGTRICISFTPDYNPVSSSDLASITSLLSTLKNAGADVITTIWHEPGNNSLTAAQYVTAVRYYAPAMRQYYPFWLCLTGPDTIESNGYYPGDAYTDGVAADQYYFPTWSSVNNSATNAAEMADNHVKPFGIWEFNAAPGANFLTGDSHTFGTSRGNWTMGSNCTTSWASTVINPFGTTMGALTVTSTGGDMKPSSGDPVSYATQFQGCSAGDEITGGVWVKAATVPRTITLGASFYTNSGTFISTLLSADASATATDSTSAWTSVFGKVTAPANAAYYHLTPEVLGTTAGEVHYLGMPYCADSTATGATQANVTVFYQWIQSYMLGRIQANKQNGDVILFNGGMPGSGNAVAIQHAADYRIGLWNSMFTALNNTSGPQALTVTRAVNGVVKSHSIGESVSLWTPPIISL